MSWVERGGSGGPEKVAWMSGTCWAVVGTAGRTEWGLVLSGVTRDRGGISCFSVVHWRFPALWVVEPQSRQKIGEREGFWGWV